MTREELGQLILSSEQQLYATAKTILHNDQDCADAIQESIVKAFSKVHTLKKDCYAKTWLIRILINECYNIARQDGRKEYLEENYMEISARSEEKSRKKYCLNTIKEYAHTRKCLRSGKTKMESNQGIYLFCENGMGRNTQAA